MKTYLFLVSGKQFLLQFSFLLAALSDVASQDKTNPKAEDFPMASIPDTELRTFHSTILHTSRVSLPQ